MVAWLTLGNPVSGFSLSSGWTPFSWSPMVDGTAYQVFGYYKVATAADGGATYTASWTGTSKGAFTIAAYSGVDNAAPLAGSAGLVRQQQLHQPQHAVARLVRRDELGGGAVFHPVHDQLKQEQLLDARPGTHRAS